MLEITKVTRIICVRLRNIIYIRKNKLENNITLTEQFQKIIRKILKTEAKSISLNMTIHFPDLAQALQLKVAVLS